jgi:hypothetical protein
MALDTFTYCWKSVLLQCPKAGPMLAQRWVNWSFRKIAEQRRWTWLQKSSQFLINDVVSTGTATTVAGSPIVTGVGTAWDGTLIGRQFRCGISYPIYTISNVDNGAQTLTLDAVWGGPSITGGSYLIYNAYMTVPSDFHAFISAWDPAFNWQLWTDVTQAELNQWDSQRANSGTAWVFSFRDYDPLTPAGTPPLPRYEIWPPQFSAKPYPFLYEARATDLNDTGASLPRYIRGDVLVEGALWQAALWPGADRENPNPYFNLSLASQHKENFLRDVYDMERQDDEMSDIDVTYQSVPKNMAPLAYGDSRYMQSHAF